MSFVLAYNPTDGPVIIDSAGRSLGGGEFGAVDTSDDLARAAVAAGRLVQPDPPGKGANPVAVQAHRRAEALTDRQTAFTALDKPRLHDLAVDAELIAVDDDPHKAEIVTALVHSSVDTPTAATTTAPKE
jgi:hypothetical protein